MNTDTKESIQAGSGGSPATAPPARQDEARVGGRPRELGSRPDGDGSKEGDVRMPGGAFALGALFLGLSVVSSLLMVLEHIGGLSLPGCGPGSGCDEAARSVWGSVPVGGSKWPVSFVGFAYFAGAFVAWLMSREGTTSLFRNMVRLGALVSIGYIILMVANGYVCWYCIGSHAGNLAFWLLMERTRAAWSPSLRPVLACVVVFAVASSVTGSVKWQREARTLAESDRKADESIQQLISERRVDREPVQVGVVDPEGEGKGFTGRYRVGPEEAPIRIVMITDYQCPDCRAVEMKAREVLKRRDDVSLSIKHFPMDKRCNPEVNRTLHANACWGARAAETAGILRGNEGFWQMHNWLFDNRGQFTNDVLNEALKGFGYDVQEFLQTMQGPIPQGLILEDIREAVDLGLHFTPMIFINGLQLRNVYEANAGKLVEAVEKLAATNPPPMPATVDQPPRAVEKYVGDWEANPTLPLPADAYAWPRGPSSARVKVVIWGDLQEKGTVELDRAVVRWMADKPDVQYSFRHFPFHQECNPVLAVESKHPYACLASRAAEAAGQLGGIDGYWRMHDWLMENHQKVSDQSLRQAASELGFNPDALIQMMSTDAVKGAIEEDCVAAKRSKDTQVTLLWRSSIPTIYINNKLVPWWRIKEQVIIDKILDAAYKQ